MQTFTVSIVAWDEHQERSDRKNYTWFKFHSKSIDGHLWLHTSHEEFRVWVYLMCRRNRDAGALVHITDTIVAANCMVPVKSVSKIIRKLVELGAIKEEGGIHAVDSPPYDGVMPSPEESRGDKSRGEESAAASPLTPEWLLGKWNEFSGTLPKPRSLDPERTRQAKLRLRESPNCDDWITAIKRCATSTKCLGFENDPGKFQNWKADFDWFIKPGRLNQILEGKWDSRRGLQNRGGPHPFVQAVNAKKEGA